MISSISESFYTPQLKHYIDCDFMTTPGLGFHLFFIFIFIFWIYLFNSQEFSEHNQTFNFTFCFLSQCFSSLFLSCGDLHRNSCSVVVRLLAGNLTDVHQHMNGPRKCDMHAQWSVSPIKTEGMSPLLGEGYNWEFFH